MDRFPILPSPPLFKRWRMQVRYGLLRPARVGVIIGSGIGGAETLLTQYDILVSEGRVA